MIRLVRVAAGVAVTWWSVFRIRMWRKEWYG